MSPSTLASFTVSISADGSVSVTQESDSPLASLPTPPSSLVDACWAPDGAHALVAAKTGELYLLAPTEPKVLVFHPLRQGESTGSLDRVFWVPSSSSSSSPLFLVVGQQCTQLKLYSLLPGARNIQELSSLTLDGGDGDLEFGPVCMDSTGSFVVMSYR